MNVETYCFVHSFKTFYLYRTDLIMKRALEIESESLLMQKELDKVLIDALARNPSRLSFETTYDHINMFDWFKTLLPDWTIVIPDKSCSVYALSKWPKKVTRKDVKAWLEEKQYENPNDLIDGACEPLAYYLSSSISEFHLNRKIDLDTIAQQKRFVFSAYKQIKSGLEQLQPRVAADLIFGEYIKQNSPSPQFWPEISEGNFNHFLFGHPLAKERIREVIASGGSTKIIPLYVLCYLFDKNELSNSQLKSTKLESAQYSLHAVGLVIDSSLKTIIVADPNGGLKGGFNMEFLSMPLTKLESKPTTSLSRYDRDQVGTEQKDTNNTKGKTASGKLARR